MRQRVGFARALSLNPEIILMDEPFSSVDEQTRELLQEQLLELWAASNKTILFITHSIDEAVYMADRIVVMGGAFRVGSSKKSRSICPAPPLGCGTRRPAFSVKSAPHAWEILKAAMREAADEKHSGMNVPADIAAQAELEGARPAAPRAADRDCGHAGRVSWQPGRPWGA